MTSNNTPTITTSLSADATTISTAQMPSHTHSMNIGGVASPAFVRVENPTPGELGTNTGATGGGLSHTHSVSGSATSSAVTLNVAYVDLIIASKA